MDVLKAIFNCGILPVIKLDSSLDAYPLCEALNKGGINVAEITFRTAAAEESIKIVSEKLPQVLVGAGTVLNVETCEKAIAAGAKFIVTPGFNPSVVKYCVEKGIPIFPGVTCPTDIDAALGFGLSVLKFFPAESYGGMKTLKAITAPYPMVRFVPTGGIDASNMTEYLRSEKVLAIGGSFMIKEDLIKAKKFDEITKLAADAVDKLHGFEFLHLGINPDGETAEEIANKFTDAFGFTQNEKTMSIFASDALEIMKEQGPGQCGHIAIRCNNVARAISYLERKGIETDKETIRGSEDKPTFIYLKNNFGPFKVHLIQ